MAAFPAGTCLDISFVRLPNPASAYSVTSGNNASATFNQVVQQLINGGMDAPYFKYLVYMDGFAQASDEICGTGSGDFDVGPGYAIVWMRACGVPTDAVAAHELLHALGALPAGAPHPCPGDNGHPCDSTTDILYPVASGVPITSYVLDYNHDDYYGHSGSVAGHPGLDLDAPAERSRGAAHGERGGRPR